MIKRSVLFLTLLTVVALLTTVAVGATMSRVNDEAGMLDAADRDKLVATLDSLSQEHGFDFAVVTVTSLDGEYIGDYANDYYADAGFGDDGVLFLYSRADNEGYILPEGFGQTAFTASAQDYIFDEITDEMRAGDYYGAFMEFANYSEQFVIDAKNGEPYGETEFDVLWSAVIAIVVGFVVAFIVTGTMKASLKSVRTQTHASNYQRRGSLALERSNDYFLYSNVTRVKKETNSSGGSGVSLDRHGGSSRKF